MDPQTNQVGTTPPNGAPYPSVVANLFDTGLHQVIFVTPSSGRGRMEVTEKDFADSISLEAMVARTKALGSLGTLAGERAFSIDLLRDVCRHASDPFKLAGFATYEPTFFDLAVCAHGSLDGARPVWDQLIGPNLTRLGISVDPGVVPRSPFLPDGGVLEKPTPIGTAADPAMALVFKLQEVLREAGAYHVNNDDQLLSATEWWKSEVAPLLAGPFLSGV